MITFEWAKEMVAATIPGGGQMEPYGYQSPRRWFPVIAPERAGGRVAGVDKNSGAITWMSANEPEYMGAELVGTRP